MILFSYCCIFTIVVRRGLFIGLEKCAGLMRYMVGNQMFAKSVTEEFNNLLLWYFV